MLRVLLWIGCGWLASGWTAAHPLRMAPDNGRITGVILDRETLEPIPFVQILLEELHKKTTTDGLGQFGFLQVPEGTYSLRIFRIGYKPITRRVTVVPNENLQLSITMDAAAQDGGAVVVLGEKTEALAKPALTVDGSALRENLSGTIAETLLGAPGLAMRSMGPAPARPVLRGLGGDRLAILEDGGKTGDLSGSSADHAVIIEPLNAESIEILRGPAALPFSSSAAGGVINVTRNFIPTHQPEKLHLGVHSQAETVNRGGAGGFTLGLPLGHWALHTDGSYRQTSDVRTPTGILKNTDLQTWSGSLGLSQIRNWGHAGAFYTHYNSHYGIPGGFVGAHPNGVRIKLYRNQAGAEWTYLNPNRYLPQIEAKTNFTYYFHQELESSGAVGMEFQTDELETTVHAHTRASGGLQKGRAGLGYSLRHYHVGGLVFAPNAIESSAFGYVTQGWENHRWVVQAGARYDYRLVTPAEEKQAKIGYIRQRAFDGFSGSLSGALKITTAFSVGAILNRTFRIPGVEELFTEGPHLAAYSYDTGNPELSAEKGWGLELNAGYQTSRAGMTISWFQNRFDQFLYLFNTGKINYRTLLPIYQYGETQALLQGAEASWKLNLNRRSEWSGSFSYVQGKQVIEDKPLPQMPPLNGHTEWTFRVADWTLKPGIKIALAQHQLGEFEEATEGYWFPNLSLSYRITRHGKLHTFDLVGENLSNTTYRDHLSRVKSIMPEPGRNIKLLYRLYW